jgi:hypothetical protein
VSPGRKRGGGDDRESIVSAVAIDSNISSKSKIPLALLP